MYIGGRMSKILKSTSKTYFYGRVSSKTQSLNRQIDQNDIEIEERNIYTDMVSGKDMNRPQYQLLRNNLRPQDTLIIKELDRLRPEYGFNQTRMELLYRI